MLMRSFWLYRSNLNILEYYHNIKELKQFKNKCHDYYLLFPLWLLENDYYDEVIIWRLSTKKLKDIVFNINGKKYIQRWVRSFNETLNYPSPEISFFRGGFKEYDILTQKNPKHLGKKIYLGAGKRIFSQWNGIYDIYLIEDERDFVSNRNCVYFYKTASPKIFNPIENIEKKYDICWPCNFTQIKYKGQEFFISLISKHPFLQKLKIIHCGNKSDIGKQLCKEYNISNIEFAGSVTRKELNKILNKSKFGLNVSNLNDGCPRVSTEILMSGTPLIIRNKTRLLNDFKQHGVVIINEHNILNQIIYAFKKYNQLKNEVLNIIKKEISFDNINKKNIERW
jgi:hypothetical protein